MKLWANRSALGLNVGGEMKEKRAGIDNDPVVLSAAEALEEGRLEDEGLALTEIEVEEVSIDGICGVY